MGPIAVEPAKAAPRLEHVDGNAPPPQDHRLLPESGIPEAGPQAASPVAPQWTPDQAAGVVALQHNGGAWALLGNPETIPSWLASPDELGNDGSAALARLFDRIPWLTPSDGPSGGTLIVDIATALGSIIRLERKKVEAVRKAAEKADKRQEREERRYPPPPEQPPLQTAVDAMAPAPPPQKPPRNGNRGGFAFSKDQLAMLEGGLTSALDHHGNIKNPDAL